MISASGVPLLDITFLTARVVLGLVFLAAGITKLRDRSGARQAFLDFGVPVGVAPALVTLLPFAELATAAALFTARWARYGATAALTLLALFTAAIIVSLSRGRKPDCHCFGQVSSGPIGWHTVARNLVLASLAGLILWAGRPGPDAVEWLRALEIGGDAALFVGLLLLFLVLLEGWMLLKLFTQHGRLLLRIEALEARLPRASPGLAIGSPAPAFALSSTRGNTVTLDALRAAGTPTLLLFSDPGCGPCLSLMPEVRSWEQQHAARLTVAVISRGTAEQNRARNEDDGAGRTLIQTNREVAEAYRASGTPSAVIVRPDGTIGSPLAQGADAIRRLMTETIKEVRSSRATVKRGDPAPDVVLPDLDGRTVDLHERRDRESVLLFWNPGCGFCQRIVSDLRNWEARSSVGRELVLVSTGSAEVNRAMGIHSTITLDPSFATARSFGVQGTPSAVLIDPEGRVASDLAEGPEAVLGLLGVPSRTSSS